MILFKDEKANVNNLVRSDFCRDVLWVQLSSHILGITIRKDLKGAPKNITWGSVNIDQAQNPQK